MKRTNETSPPDAGRPAMRLRATARECFTGKVRIPRKDARFELVKDQSGGWLLRMVELRLVDSEDDGSGTDFPANARVVVEGRGRTAYERLELGTVGSPGPREIPLTTDPQLLGRFRLIVVDSAAQPGRILGECPSILQSREGDEIVSKDTLLPLRLTPTLGEIPWKVQWAEGEARLELCLNSRIPDILDRLRGDSIFQALVLPVALEQILRSVASDLVRGTGQWDEKWIEAWLRWGEERADLAPPGAGADEEEWDEWVAAVVEAFAEKHGFVRNWPGVTGAGGNE